jgi:hypothetical protein
VPERISVVTVRVEEVGEAEMDLALGQVQRTFEMAASVVSAAEPGVR